MSSSYSFNAEFEDIDAPELITSFLYLLGKEGWIIKDYKDSFLKVQKKINSDLNAILTVSIIRSQVTIECESELTEEGNQEIVENLVKNLLQFISDPQFDTKVREHKHHYFMGNPLDEAPRKDKQTEPSELEVLFSFRKSFRITPTLILMNVLVFMVMVFAGISFTLPLSEQILAWGGNNRTLVLEGDWWRILTSCFLHYGIIHLLFNMWALFNIGIYLERMVGGGRFAFAYFISGLAGGLNSNVWHANAAGAGASGAIFGLLGLLFALLTSNILEKGFRNSMLRSLIPMLLFNLLIGTAAQIDNAAHLGGLIAGFLCGYLFAWHYKYPRNKAINLFSFILPLLLIFTSGFIIDQTLPDPYGQYFKALDKIEQLEFQAMKSVKYAHDKDSMAKTNHLWEEAIKESKNILSLDLEDRIVEKNGRRVFYLEKRKQLTMYLNPSDSLLWRQTKTSIDSINILMNKKER